MNKITAIVMVVALITVGIIGLQNHKDNCCENDSGAELNISPEQIILRDFFGHDEIWHDIPEPGTWSLMLIGIAAMVYIKRIEKEK